MTARKKRRQRQLSKGQIGRGLARMAGTCILHFSYQNLISGRTGVVGEAKKEPLSVVTM
jgi:hypothetical protein